MARRLPEAIQVSEPKREVTIMQYRLTSECVQMIEDIREALGIASTSAIVEMSVRSFLKTEGMLDDLRKKRVTL